jgi:hypothetical protein
VSRRDLAHVMTALWDLSGATAGVAVAVAEVDKAIGRGRGDMRTPLKLRSLADDGIVEELDAGAWALPPRGVATIAEDRDLSDR